MGRAVPEYPAGSLDSLLRAAATAQPNRIAVLSESSALTYAELDDRVSRFATALREIAEASDTVVALASPLHPDFCVAFYGILRAGRIVAPINPFMREGELAHLLAGAGAGVAVVTPALLGQLTAIRDRLPGLHTVIVLADNGPDGVATVAELVARVPAGTQAPSHAFDADDVACVHFTSGTTGAAKAVMLSHRNLTANAAHTAYAHHLTGTSVMLNYLPKFHLIHLNSAIFAGATHVLCDSVEMPDSIAMANRFEATHYYTIPMRLARLAAAPEFETLAFSTVRMIASGGSALAPKVAKALSEQFGVPVFQGYGLAETSSLTHSDGPVAPKFGSVGPVVLDTECRIIDIDTGAELPTGDRGEVQVRGPQVMVGYRNRAADPVIDRGINADGWLATGDVGYLDEDGYLFLVDRIKDVFKSDNFLVSPSEIEHTVLRHPGITECVIVDVPDEFSGAVPAAFVVLADGVPPASVDAIADEVNADLPYYKRLRHVEAVTEIPRAPMGKVDRKKARAAMLASLSHSETPTHISNGGPAMVTLINKFTVKGDPAEFEQVWHETSEFMRAQPGFLGYRFGRSLMDPTVYVNVANWASADAHLKVLQSDGFQDHIAKLAPLCTPAPELFEPIFEGEPIQ
jgi:long-chain acyl-CoA synthetase